MKPKEGTILTVAKGIAQKAAEMAETTDDLEVFIPEVHRNMPGICALRRLRDMLPVLEGCRRCRFRRTRSGRGIERCIRRFPGKRD